MILNSTLILIFLFSLAYILCSASFSNGNNNALSFNFKSPEKREDFVKFVLDTKISLGTLPEESIFEDTNEVIASISGISVSEQHLISLKALCDYVTKICIKALIDFSTGSLTRNDRDFVLQIICVTAHEFNFAKILKNFDFFDNYIIGVVQFLLEFLAKLDPLSDEHITRVSVLNLSQFCVSNDCLDVFFSIIFKSLENSYKLRMPIFALNSKIKDTSKIDQHFRSCVKFMKSSESKQIAPVPLAMTIVESPFSNESTKIFMNLINTEELLIQFAQLNMSENKLVFRMIKSKEIDNFIKLCTANLCARNAAVNSLKNALQSRKLELELILQVIKPDQNIDQMSLTDITDYILNINFDEKILISYYEVDSELVEELIRKLDQNVQKTILIMKNISNPTEKYIYLTLAYFFVRLIPIYKSDFLSKANYELLLDFKLEIENKGERCNIPYSTLVKALLFPYVEVTLRGLENIWSIIKSDFEGSDLLIICTASTILTIHSSNQIYAVELFKMLFFFFRSHQIDFSLVARNIIQEFSDQNFIDIFDFCKQHKMLSKAEIFIIENCLSNWKNDKDTYNFNKI